MSRARPRVQLAHGLEGSPQGAKARALGEVCDLHCPAMPTPDLDACVGVHRALLEESAPELLVGSSFGGAVVWRLLAEGAWSGPCLLLAPAAARLGLPWRLPQEVRTGPLWVVHGLQDELLPWNDSLELARRNPERGLQLVLVDDDHRLGRWTAAGGLVELALRALAKQP